MSETLYHVSANPPVRDNGSTQKIMLDVIIALLPLQFLVSISLEHLRH